MGDNKEHNMPAMCPQSPYSGCPPQPKKSHQASSLPWTTNDTRTYKGAQDNDYKNTSQPGALGSAVAHPPVLIVWNGKDVWYNHCDD